VKLEIGVISPQDWGLPAVVDAPAEAVFALPGVTQADVEARARAATYEWLLRQFDEDAGAFHGFYRAPDRHLDFPQTVNLIAPWQLLAAYDRYRDDALLQRAVRAANWFYEQHVITHPMSVVAGGVRDGLATDELWTKFTAEEVLICLGLWSRTSDEIWRERARQCGRFLIQARRHDFAPRHSLSTGLWIAHGWDSWGRVIEAALLLRQVDDDPRWLDEAERWAGHALAIQAEDGGFYLIDDEYFNTDLAADELRALVMLHELTGKEAYLSAAIRFADWLLDHQDADGAWPLTIDLEGNIVMPVIGPGDAPNIGIALLRLYHINHDRRYLRAACATVRYSLMVQAVPGSDHPYIDDERVRWGFWSWQPHYDYTLSGDQSTHHARGMWFLLDYLRACPPTDEA
jgi:hypothetical protein